MRNKIAKITGAVSALGCFAAKTAFADTAGITEQTADTLGNKMVTLANNIMEPLGAAVIFISILIAGVRIILSSGRPEERSRAISALPYILGGGFLLGGAMLVAGFIIGTGKSLG